jgi:hypothetical protein
MFGVVHSGLGHDCAPCCRTLSHFSLGDNVPAHDRLPAWEVPPGGRFRRWNRAPRGVPRPTGNPRGHASPVPAPPGTPPSSRPRRGRVCMRGSECDQRPRRGTPGRGEPKQVGLA